jgi:hypothetical protein
VEQPKFFLCVSLSNLQITTDESNKQRYLQFLAEMATVGMFDWRLFDNSNRTKVVRRPKKLGCSTQIMFNGKLTIVEHKINRTKSEI